MKPLKHPRLAAYGTALGFFLGGLAPVYHSFAQEKERREFSLVALAPNEVTSPICGYYIEQEYTDGFILPKIIAYYESEEDREWKQASCFSLRNGDGTYTILAAPGKERKCSGCHKEPKVRDYLFMKPGRKPI